MSARPVVCEQARPRAKPWRAAGTVRAASWRPDAQLRRANMHIQKVDANA